MRRKKKRRVLPLAMLAGVLALAVWLILVTRVFIIREVVVEGAGGVAQTDVMRMSGIRLGTRMGRLDEREVRSGVEGDGRLAFVSLEERYPSTVVLTVRERTRDAMISQGGKVLVLDSDAYVVSVGDQLPEKSLPYVTGLRPSSYAIGRQLDTSDGRCAAMKAVLEGLRAHNAWAYVSEISVADLNNLTITSRTGMAVLLGDSSNMNNKILWMAGALSDLEKRGEVTGQLDVSSGDKADYMGTPRREEITLDSLGQEGYGS